MIFRKQKEESKLIYNQEYVESQIQLLIDCGKFTEARFWEIRFALTHDYDIDIVGDRWRKNTIRNHKK